MMTKAVLLNFGMPKYGWLPVDFHYHTFHIHFDASDALNDPVKELHEVITESQDYKCKRITWYFEPGAVFFDISKEGNNVVMIITETDDLHDENNYGAVLIEIIACEEQIIKPLGIAVEQFYLHTYKEEDWPFGKDNS